MPERNLTKWRQAEKALKQQAKDLASLNSNLQYLTDTLERTTSIFRGFFLRVTALGQLLQEKGAYTNEELHAKVESLLQASRKDLGGSQVPPK